MAIAIDFSQHRATYFSKTEPNNYQLGSENYLLNAEARLENREDLLYALGVPAAEHVGFDQGILLLRAYNRWGTDMFCRLRGDWWIAFWDGNRQRIIVAVCPTGPVSVFYTRLRDNRLALAAGVTPLLRLPGVSSELREERMLSYLLRWVNYQDYTQTEYSAIRQLRAGTWISFGISGQDEHVYWDPKNFQVQNGITQQEANEEFLRLYRHAVESCLPLFGKTGSTLSAGLDSGSVSALAATSLARKGDTLSCYTHVPISEAVNLQIPGRLVNEWNDAALLADMYPNIDHIAVRSDDVSIVNASVRALRTTARMQAANINISWIHQLYSQARDDGISTLLLGQAGNLIVSWEGPGVNFWHLLACGRWKQAYQRANASGISRIARTCAGDGWRLIKSSQQFPAVRFETLRSRIASQDLMNRWQQVFEREANDTVRHSVRAYRDQSLPMLFCTLSFISEFSRSFGIRSVDPTSNQDLIEWCLRLPDEYFCDASQNRLLMRQAMNGLMPEKTRLERIRGLQPADLSIRYQLQREQLEDVMTRMRASPLVQHYIDLTQFEKTWQSCLSSTQYTKDVADFQLGLQAGLFLLEYETRYR